MTHFFITKPLWNLASRNEDAESPVSSGISLPQGIKKLTSLFSVIIINGATTTSMKIYFSILVLVWNTMKVIKSKNKNKRLKNPISMRTVVLIVNKVIVVFK